MTGRGGSPKACFLMFDQRTEALAKAIGLEICFPSAALRNRLDNKIETVRVGNRAGVPSVPNALAKVSSHADLCNAAAAAGLGTDLVVQTAFGDSGHTTFFIASDAAYRRYRTKSKLSRKSRSCADCAAAAVLLRPVRRATARSSVR